MSVRRVFACLCGLLLLATVAASAHAGTLTISTTSGRLGDGGEFRVTGFDDAYAPRYANLVAVDGGDFNTFCMERNEFISLGSSYVYTIDTGARNGGVSGGNPDPLGTATAKLYYTFWSGQWDVSSASDLDQNLTYNYTAATQRGKDGRDLQHALWFLEGEITQTELNNYVNSVSGSQAQAMVNYALDADLSWSDLGMSGWSDIGGVRIVNLYDTNGTARQSQLVVVPLPAAALMGFSLLGSLGLVSLLRRRNRNNLTSSATTGPRVRAAEGRRASLEDDVEAARGECGKCVLVRSARRAVTRPDGDE